MPIKAPLVPPRERILLVDDQAEARTAMAALLSAQGFDLVCAGDAPEAMAWLGRECFDLLIVDSAMPGNRELELVRQMPTLNVGIPAIVATANPTLEAAIAAVELPVLAFLAKPAVPEILLEHVARGLSFRRVAGTLGAMADSLKGWSGEMERVRRDFHASPTAMARGSLLGALTLSLGRAAESLLDIEKLTRLAVDLDLEKTEGCTMPNCPRGEVLEGALREGIRVLEATKDSFRSKEMGALRKRYESLLAKSVR
jgi:CheY-like chemotaxis protein